MARVSFSSTTESISWLLIYGLRTVFVALALLVILAVSLIGNFDRSQITTTLVPKATALDDDPHERTLAAIVPHERQAWFFKLSGPDKLVASLSDGFTAFMRTVRFPAGVSHPRWIIPDGWRQLPEFSPQNMGRFKRFATLQIPSQQRFLELSVTTLPLPPSDYASYELSNINRWRDQLQLPPIDAQQLEKESQRIDLDGPTATLVEMVGTLKVAGIKAAPFAEGKMVTPTLLGSMDLTFMVPEGWQQTKGTGFSAYAYMVEEGDRRAEITITPLAAAAGDLLPNVNRWRGQIGLGPLTQEELDQQIEPVRVDTETGRFIVMKGADEMILGAIVVHGQTAWFFKLMGDSKLAQREQERFRAFVESVRFGGADGATDGD